MKISILSWNVRGLNEGKKGLIKILLKKWKYNGLVLRERKMEGDITNIARHVQVSIQVDFVNLKVIVTRGGILIMLDKRVLDGKLVESGNQSITCKLTDSRQNITWFIIGVYGSNNGRKGLEL